MGTSSHYRGHMAKMGKRAKSDFLVGEGDISVNGGTWGKAKNNFNRFVKNGIQFYLAKSFKNVILASGGVEVVLDTLNPGISFAIHFFLAMKNIRTEKNGFAITFKDKVIEFSTIVELANRLFILIDEKGDTKHSSITRNAISEYLSGLTNRFNHDKISRSDMYFSEIKEAILWFENHLFIYFANETFYKVEEQVGHYDWSINEKEQEIRRYIASLIQNNTPSLKNSLSEKIIMEIYKNVLNEIVRTNRDED